MIRNGKVLFLKKKMIQRIQSLFMLLFVATGAANFLFFPSEVIVFSSSSETDLTSVPYVSALLSGVVLINIFLFSNRKLQLLINRMVWVLFTLFWGSFVFFIVKNAELQFSAFFPDLSFAFVGEVALLLANTFIKKDEALVRSLDRLR